MIDEKTIKDKFNEVFRVVFPIEPHVREDGSIDVIGRVRTWKIKCRDLPVKLNYVSESLEMSEMALENLKGCPAEVGKDFDCSINNLTSLVNGPEAVGRDYHCHTNNLTNLIGAPINMKSGGFSCYKNKLISLEGSPRHIEGDFDIADNPTLTSLEGSPDRVGGTYMAEQCGITSLVGATQKVGHDFSVSSNKITNLIGAPREIHGRLWLANNPLTSLEGLPMIVEGGIILTHSPRLPLLRLLACNTPDIQVQGMDFAGVAVINTIIMRYNVMYRTSKNKAMLGAQKDLIAAGYGGNAKW